MAILTILSKKVFPIESLEIILDVPGVFTIGLIVAD